MDMLLVTVDNFSFLNLSFPVCLPPSPLFAFFPGTWYLAKLFSPNLASSKLLSSSQLASGKNNKS